MIVTLLWVGPPVPHEPVDLDTQRWATMIAASLAVAAFLAANLPRMKRFSFEEVLVRFGILWLLGSIIYGVGETLHLWSWGVTLRVGMLFVGCIYIVIAETMIVWQMWRIRRLMRRHRRRPD